MIVLVIYVVLLLYTSNADLTANICNLVIKITPEKNEIVHCNSEGLSVINRTLTFTHFDLLQVGKLESIVEIHISNSDAETITTEHFSLDFLKTLNLSNNSIKNLNKDTFEIVPNAEVLDLSRNQLEENDILAFHNLSSLKQLYLSYNNLKAINSYSFESLFKLEVLDLSRNSLFTVSPTFLSDHNNLHTLYLLHNELTTINLRIPSVKDLDASFNKIESLNLPDLHRLNLDHNKISTAISFSDMSINIANNNITDFKVLSEDTRYIYASYNQIETIATSFFPNQNHLEYLDLSNNLITNIENNALANLNRLTYINLSHNKMVDLKFRAFDSLTSLEILDISYNNFIYLYDIPFADSFTFDNLAKLSKIILNNNQWPCNFLKQLSKATVSVIGAHSTCKSDMNDFVIDFDKSVPVESEIPGSGNVDEDEIVRIVQKHFLNTLVDSLRNITQTFRDYKEQLNNDTMINIADKHLDANSIHALVDEYIRNSTVFRDIGNQECMYHTSEHQSNHNKTEDFTIDRFVNKMFAYILLINTITTALLLLVIIIGLCVIFKRRKYKVQNYDDY